MLQVESCQYSCFSAATSIEGFREELFDPDEKLIMFTRVPAPSGYASPSPQAGGFKLIQSVLDCAHPSGRESGLKSS